MKTLLQYNRHTPELSDGFYHAESPYLFAAHDTITNLAECPFPLMADTFRVVTFGTVKDQPDDLAKGYGHSKKFAVVEYVKRCGHLARERIAFMEGVEDFDHYGTKFAGDSYSITNWASRIEYFRQTDCEVCNMIRHALWCWSEGLSGTGRAKAIAGLLHRLEWNYSNWREFADWADVERRFHAPKSVLTLNR